MHAGASSIEPARSDRRSGLIAASRGGFLLGPAGKGVVADRRIDRAIVGLLAVAVLLPGAVAALGLPGELEATIDLAAVLIGLWIASVLVRDRVPAFVPYLVLAYVAVILVGALQTDDPMRMFVAARNFLLFPFLALVLAFAGPSERRLRWVVATILGLAALEFVITIVQSRTVTDIDLIVGTFGDYSGPSTAVAIEIGTCLALGVFAARAGGVWWVAFALVLPLVSVWAAIRLMPIVVPITIVAVAVAAAWAARSEALHRARWWRPGIVAAVAVASAVVLFGGYAIYRPYDFELFTDAESRSEYLDKATVAAPPRGKDTAAGRTAEAQAAGTVPVAGRGSQYRTAAALVDGGPLTLVFGLGLGATTYADNLGIDEPSDERLVSAGYSDAGTLLVELGWLGVCLIVACAIALGLYSLGAARNAAPGSWTRALLIAYPGILVAMAAGAFHGTPFRNAGSAAIFWILTGLVLAAILDRSRRAQGTADNDSIEAPIHSLVRRKPSANSTAGL